MSALTYAEYKEFVLANLWRTGDAVLEANLDSLIGNADNELRARTADWQKRQQSVNILPTSEDFDVTANVPGFESVVAVVKNGVAGYYQGKQTKTLLATTPAQVYSSRANYPLQYVAEYAIESVGQNIFLRFAGPFTVDSPGDFQLIYYGGVPDYQTTDASWLQSEYGGLYLNTILKHCAMFVREDDRVQLYSGLADQAFSLGDQEDKHRRQFGGSPLKMKPHHPVP